MKIALINFWLNNNYGGNLQRYALVKVLQNLGHKVVHINLRQELSIDWFRLSPHIIFRILKKMIGLQHAPILYEYKIHQKYYENIQLIESFYNRYIPHSYQVKHLSDYSDYDKFDAIIVGSDQIWRPWSPMGYVYSNFFLDFLPINNRQIRIAYGISLGTRENEYSSDDIIKLRKFYNAFKAVSVREESALSLFNSYGWSSPLATTVLDPVLLLNKSDYIKLMPLFRKKLDMFCYVLDINDLKVNFIKQCSLSFNMKFVIESAEDNAELSLKQWLSCFYKSKFIITDSFHGMVLSIVFHKPFFVIGNERRGMSRFQSLLSIVNLQSRLLNENNLDVIPVLNNIDWNIVDDKLKSWRDISIDFLNTNLK